MSGNVVWDIERALRRMGDRQFGKHEEIYRKVAVRANATRNLSLSRIFLSPASEVLDSIFGRVSRPEFSGLLNHDAQQACLRALDAILRALAGTPTNPSIRSIMIDPAAHATLVPLFAELDRIAPVIPAPFLQPDYDPALAVGGLDDLLALLGADYTLVDLYERQPRPAMLPTFNRVLVRAKRAGLLLDLTGIRRPAGRGYVADPKDDRWDVRSCVPPENAVLFREVHVKINTMAYLMSGLTYGDFFDLPLINPKVLPHIRARVEGDADYWFTATEKTRILAALDGILDYLRQAVAHSGLTFRQVYADPDTPLEVLIQFQRILDVKPEICLPFMAHDFDHAAAGDAIDVFLASAGALDLKGWYTTPGARYVSPPNLDKQHRLNLAARTLLDKVNDLTCVAVDMCAEQPYDWCSCVPPYENC